MQNDNAKFKINSENKSNSIDGGFLQSKYWGRFQKEIERKIIEVGGEDFSALMIFYDLPIVGGYFFVPRGPLLKYPIINNQSSNNTQYSIPNIQKFIKKMILVAKESSVGWVRIEPQTEKDLAMIREAARGEYKVVKSKKDHEPAQTIMLDLAKSEEELLADMKQKTRYNVRLAGKKGVIIEKSKSKEAIESFLSLTKITAQRDRITPHPNWYYQKMLETIPEENLHLYIARYEGKIICANLVSFYGGVATYLHGASANEHRNVMAPFALQWTAILDAKKEGYEKYDFGGTKIAKDGKYEESWSGISRFKQGFCPKCQPVEFPGCWDIIIDNKKYILYKFLQAGKDLLRKIKS